MELHIFQKGFNYSQDGNGNRLVYHLQGCNMRCPWCANPEGMDRIPPLVVRASSLLDEVCPRGAVRAGSLDRSVCRGCTDRECVTVHKNNGIVCKCETTEVETVVSEAERCVPMFFDGGGVTLTGGEPMMQYDAVRELLKGLKEAGIHTAMETNGTHPRLSALFPLVDQLIMDCKHYDSNLHRDVTGAGNEIICDNLKKAASEQKPLLIRIPLVNGFNASAEDMKAFVRFFQKLNTTHMKFEFLPYHEYGKDKWAQCGLDYRMGSGFVPDGTVNAFTQSFHDAGLQTIKT